MKRRLLVLGSFVFSLYILLMIPTVFIMLSFVNPDDEIPVALRPIVVIALILEFLSVFGVCFFIIYDIIHIVRNKTFSSGAKVGWICAIWFLNVFAIPVYGLKHLCKETVNQRQAPAT